MQIMNKMIRLFFMSSLIVCRIMSMEKDEKGAQPCMRNNQEVQTTEQTLERLQNSLASLTDADVKEQRVKILALIKERSRKVITKDKPNS